ncbi:long-chain-fatty-acid---luciferin-component ligase [Streptosporangium becharense]|uniref:Long-chain-fatty-acid---luciferin-component ligase n=1 Tax=Streptosporangium becharense TaxID=1816182 RepID=A0A7W9MIN6_9ACTN|nr:hypothetical protein [Streptosporangium becharense]MBB2911303.1 long-chain-fatty-acid---luciferin-component ligase [Streptosporangium becharense]MBB5821639.1 long-chain-fatty-acid---luciferin-component ligase [Streptosporangium becharense]
MNEPITRDTGASLLWDPLEAVSVLDDWVFQRSDIYHASAAEIETLKLTMARNAVDHHFTHNPTYRQYCQKSGFEPDQLNTLQDLARIPLITSSQFKISQVRTGPEEAIVKVCTSSGTQGSMSLVHRDETTLCRFLGSIQGSVDQLLGLDDAFCLHLGPSKEEAGDLWFSYAMAVTDMLFPTENFVVDGVFDPAKVVRRIQEARGDAENVLLVGAPIMFLHLDEYMTENGILLEDCENLFVITAGGWKRFRGSSIPREEFVGHLTKRFQGLDPSRIRDFFNMVELNSILAECEFHVKHVPPWIHVLTLDPRTLQPVANGRQGLLAFVDPTATSYPGFILTDDYARTVLDGECRCGRRGQGIEFTRRVEKVESRGCALKLDRAQLNR